VPPNRIAAAQDPTDRFPGAPPSARPPGGSEQQVDIAARDGIFLPVSCLVAAYGQAGSTGLNLEGAQTSSRQRRTNPLPTGRPSVRRMPGPLPRAAAWST